MALLDTAELVLRANRYAGTGNWLDESGNGHDAVPSGSPTWDGEKFSLNGSSQYFTVADAPGLDMAPTDSFTLVVVAQYAAVPAANAWFISKGSSAFGGPGWWLYLPASGSVTWRAGDGAGGTFIQNRSGAINTQLVLSGRRIVSTDVARVGVSGDYTDITDNTVQTLANASGFIIGRLSSAGGYFTGDIYGVALFRTALSDDQVATVGTELVASPTPNRMGGTGAIRKPPRY